MKSKTKRVAQNSKNKNYEKSAQDINNEEKYEYDSDRAENQPAGKAAVIGLCLFHISNYTLNRPSSKIIGLLL